MGLMQALVRHHSAPFNPKTPVLIQKSRSYTGSVNSEVPGDINDAFPHWGDVLGSLNEKSYDALVSARKESVTNSMEVHGAHDLTMYFTQHVKSYAWSCI